MKKGLLVGGTVAVLALVAVAGFAAKAATDEYSFLVRVVVTEVNKSANTVSGYATHFSADAEADLSGKVQDYNVSTAKFYKWKNNQKVRIKLSGVVVGNEIVMKGVKKTNGRFNVIWLVVNETAFEINGRLQAINTSDNHMTIQVSTSTRTESRIKGKDLRLTHDDQTQFRSLGKVIQEDEVRANNQKVRVKGKVVNGDKWEVSHFWDNLN